MGNSIKDPFDRELHNVEIHVKSLKEKRVIVSKMLDAGKDDPASLIEKIKTTKHEIHTEINLSEEILTKQKEPKTEEQTKANQEKEEKLNKMKENISVEEEEVTKVLNNYERIKQKDII